MVKRASLAKCLVKYRTKSGVEEIVWNSLSGEPPPSLETRDTGEIADIVWDQERDYRPDYVPELGERIFVQMDEGA